MSKVLIIESVIIRTARYLTKSPNSEGIFDYNKLTLKKLQKDFDLYQDITHIDVSEDFQLKTNSNNEIFVLTEPKRGFKPNLMCVFDESGDFERLTAKEQAELVSLDFEVEKALEKIKKINPDIILLNNELTGSLSKETIDLYKEKYEEKTKNILELKTNSPHDYERYIPMTYNGKHLKLDKTSLKRCYEGHGSLELALLLKKEKIPFSLWTENYRNSFHDAHILDIVSKEEIISFDKNYHESVILNKTKSDEPFIASNDQGSLLHGSKHLFGPNNYHPNDKKHNTYFTENAIYILNDMIKNGKNHASK